MWEIKKTDPVKLMVGILAADQNALDAGFEKLTSDFGPFDFVSDVWPFNQTTYYKDELGDNILRQFVSAEKPIDPGKLAKIKHKTNRIEEKLAQKLNTNLPRPINLDPGYIAPSKLVLASTKDYSHRMYIGKSMYAEITLNYENKHWQPLAHTYPDYKQQCYFDFFDKVRKRLLEQLRS